MRKIVILLTIIVLLIAATWRFGIWFDSAANWALAKCTDVEQALGECTQEETR